MAKPSSDGKTNQSPENITQAVYAFRIARVLLTAFELDLFTIIGDSQMSSDEVARSAGTDSRATDRLLNAVCASGYLMKNEGKFSNTPLTAACMVKGRPGFLGGLMHQVTLWDTWSTLTEAVRIGTATHSGPVNDRGTEWLEAFISAMHTRAIHQAPGVIKLIDLDGVARVLDVGGGSGAFSMAFVRARRGIEAVVFDLPNVAKLTRSYVDAENLGKLITVVEGDYNSDSLGTGFDLVFMSAVIHSNSADENGLLFKKAFAALNPNGRLVVLDFIMDDDRTSPEFGAYFSLNMLVGTQEGDTYTESEIRRWMEAAGFGHIGRTNTPFGTDFMLGKMEA